jgi:hypothetical protein
MKIFICNRSIDIFGSDRIVDEFLTISENSIGVLREIINSNDWKEFVEQKIKQVDFIVFLLGNETFESEEIKWEYAKAKELNKHIVGIKLFPTASKSIIFYQGFPVFDDTNQCYKFLKKKYKEERILKLEQYKIMVSSTEKVTEQRLKVNNLFFTVTSSILSVAFVIGKTFNFSFTSVIGIFILTAMSFLVTFFWEKLINSYGQLNTGKFKVIDKIEKELRTNMFEDEWKILTQEIKYKPNTNTETTVIKRFRLFILLITLGELIYIVKMQINL